MKLTIEEARYYRTENKTYHFDNGFLKGLTEFNTLIEERIAMMDRHEAELWTKGSSKRKAYYIEKIKNLSSHLTKEVVNLRNFPRPKDCTEREKVLRKNTVDRITLLQIDYAVILRYSTEIAHSMGYLKLAPLLLKNFK